MGDVFLITTSLEESWETDKPVIFLGEWCKLYNRKLKWDTLTQETLRYHWDDRQKLFTDYQYLLALHERLLVVLSDELNKYHSTNHSTRYWRIVIGPWLGYFTQVVFDRWSMIELAIQSKGINRTKKIDLESEKMIPSNMDEFVDFFTQDQWNHYIYIKILETYPGVRIEMADDKPEETFLSSTIKPTSKKKSISNWIKNGVTDFLGKLSFNKDIFLHATYLPIFSEFILGLYLKQFPKLGYQLKPLGDFKPNETGRIKINVSLNAPTNFERFVCKMIPCQIPLIYLEGNVNIQEKIKHVGWPKQPKAIWTSNSHIANDFFKIWTADKVEKGAQLYIGQHGGTYGTALFTFAEDHEVAIADKFITWGWNSIVEKKTTAFGIFKTLGKAKIRNRKSEELLLVTTGTARYSFWLSSTILSASQYERYLDDQFEFVNGLSPKIKNKTRVKIFSADYGMSVKTRWLDKNLGVVIDDGSVSKMNQLIKNCRLYVSSYNGTTFLESLSFNIPTLIFWDPAHWEIRNEALLLFSELKKVGVFHESPESAVLKVNEIWDDIDGWWQTPEIQNAVNVFCGHYARTEQMTFKKLSNILINK